MTRSVCFALALGLLAAADDPKKEAVEKELKKLQGTWHVTTYEHDGKTMRGQGNWVLVIEGRTYTMKTGNITEAGTFRVDPSKKPAAVDVTPTEGAHEGETRKGIYRLDGDGAKVCFSAIGKEERPTEFVSPKGSDNYLWTFKRERK